MGVEVSKHIKHRLEPQMLDVALAVTIQRQTKMLRRQMGMVSGGGGPGLATRLEHWGLLGDYASVPLGPYGTVPCWGRSH